MKVLFADKFSQRGRNDLRRYGIDALFQPDLDGDSLAEAVRVAAPDVLVVRSTKVSGETIARAPQLKLILRAGAGYDTIDVDAASRAGIFVANCPGKNAMAVAELTWALILCCDRRVPEQTQDLGTGIWNKKSYSVARGLYGRTLGILGLGTIGREVAARGRAFGMKVIAWSRSLNAEVGASLGIACAATPLQVARESDVVSVHVASTPATVNLVDRDFIAAMKPGSYLVNTSRGDVVDEDALAWGLAERNLRAGLDVYRDEPASAAGNFSHPLWGNPSLVGTHHVGASTDQAQEAIAVEAVRIIVHFRDTGEVLHCVNRIQRSPATCLLTVRHRNRPGVLAQVFQVLSDAGINVEEMENILYDGAHVACARIQLSTEPSEPQLHALQGCCPHILGVELVRIDGTGEIT